MFKLIKRAVTRQIPCLVAVGLALFALASAVVSYQYDVPLSIAAKGLFRQSVIESVRFAVSIHDPCDPKIARLAPDQDGEGGADFDRIESRLTTKGSIAIDDGSKVFSESIHNENIIRSAFEFRYQPFDEPRLHTLRTKYNLDQIVASAPSEFDAMVALRTWVRKRFRRNDYQPITPNFDALEILDRNLVNGAEAYSPDEHFDPCVFFQLLYCQVLSSVGYQGRLVGITSHGLSEVWSNQFRKWILMDAELDLHFEKSGLPLNMAELSDENHIANGPPVEIVRGRRSPDDENPTMVHLRVAELPLRQTINWFDKHLDIADMRNDWMTNHYFRGHPSRSESNSLILMNPYLQRPLEFGRVWRSKTNRRDDFYWTLNQTEIYCRPITTRILDVAFRTVTPNYRCYQIEIDGHPPVTSAEPHFKWKLHDGKNTMKVRSVNQFEVAGIESSVALRVQAGQL